MAILYSLGGIVVLSIGSFVAMTWHEFKQETGDRYQLKKK